MKFEREQTGLRKKYSRRDFLKISVAGGLTAVGLTSSEQHTHVEHEMKNYQKAAQRAYDLIYPNFTKDGLLFDDRSSTKIVTNWPYSRLFAAAIDLRRINDTEEAQTELLNRLEGLKYFQGEVPEDAPPYLSRSLLAVDDTPNDIYYDDNAWVGQNLTRAYDFVPDPTLIHNAHVIFSKATENFHKGTTGVSWMHHDNTIDNTDINTVSNAPYVQLGVRLNEITSIPKYLEWSKTFHDFVEGSFLDRRDGLYSDHFDGEGKWDVTKWSYNQGSMIGAKALLGAATEDPAYLRSAEKLADISLAYFQGSRLYEQEVAFNAIYFRNLLYLASQTDSSTLQAGIADSFYEYSETIYRDSQNSVKDTLIEQASVAQILAMKSTPEEKYIQLL